MAFRKRVDPEVEKASVEARRILGLKGDEPEFRVVYGSMPMSDKEVAMLTRSIIEVLSDISSTVEVPPRHVAEQRVPPTMATEGEGVMGPLIRYSSRRRGRMTTSPPSRTAATGSGSTTRITAPRSSSPS